MSILFLSVGFSTNKLGTGALVVGDGTNSVVTESVVVSKIHVCVVGILAVFMTKLLLETRVVDGSAVLVVNRVIGKLVGVLVCLDVVTSAVVVSIFNIVAFVVTISLSDVGKIIFDSIVSVVVELEPLVSGSSVRLPVSSLELVGIFSTMPGSFVVDLANNVVA